MTMVGLRIGPFEIVEAATVPEAGDWYLARRTGMTRKQPAEVLVRVLGPDARDDERAALQAEYEVLRDISDPRVPVPVGYYEGTGAMALEAIAGRPLADAMQGRTGGDVWMRPATVIDVLLELCEVLVRLHGRGRAHGHLSAHNIWLAPDGRVWVFGIGSGSQTAVAPEWQAPERARGEAATAATDQWSLGAIGAALVTGRAPWPGDDPDAQASRGSPDLMVGSVESQWPALGRLLRQVLDPRPANRLADVHAVRLELLGLSRKAGGTSDRRELGALLNRRAEDEVPAVFAPDLPDESMDVVQPAVSDDDVPVAGSPSQSDLETEIAQDRMETEMVSSFDDLPGVSAEDETVLLPGGVEPDLEPSEATVLFDEAHLRAMLTDEQPSPFAEHVEPDVEPSEATVLFSQSMLDDAAQELGVLLQPETQSGEAWSGPTAVPITGSDDDDPPPLGDINPDHAHGEPALNLPDGPLPQELPPRQVSLIQRLAPVAAFTAFLLFIAWMVVTLMS